MAAWIPRSARQRQALHRLDIEPGSVRPLGGPISPPRPTTDPVRPDITPVNAVERWLVTRLRDPRDLHFCRVSAKLAVPLFTMAALYYAEVLPVWTVVLWMPMLFTQIAGRYTLMLHAVCHRAMFRKEDWLLEAVIPWVLGPFVGHTPGSFYAHHIGMHHPENNLGEDLSTTMPYRRDHLPSFFHYWARFFFAGQLHLWRYLHQRRRDAIARRWLLGEGTWFVVMVGLLAWAPGPTFAVFVLPFLLIRFFMMTGNWSQHAFVDPDRPGSAYGNSTCLINIRYNHVSYNDGYHVVHHLKPNLHWTEMAAWYHDRLDTFGAEDALVFDGLGNNQVVWWCLMTGDYDRLARHVVDLPGAPVRSHEEKVAWLQRRVRTPIGHRRGLLELAPAPLREAA